MTLSHNGMLGMNAVYADGLVVSSVLSEHNKQRIVQLRARFQVA